MEATTASFVAAIFSYKGSRDPQAVRAKDLAQQDAVKAMALLRKGATLESLPARARCDADEAGLDGRSRCARA